MIHTLNMDKFLFIIYHSNKFTNINNTIFQRTRWQNDHTHYNVNIYDGLQNSPKKIIKKHHVKQNKN